MGIKSIALGASAVLLSTSADATLLSRLDGQAVYDTDLNITWLSNANLALTNQFGLALSVSQFGGEIGNTGLMTWNNANAWISGMNADGGSGYLGYSNWRLPDTIFPDAGCSNDGSGNNTFGGSKCSSSEMGHLFYNEFGATESITSTSLDNADVVELAKFSNMQTSNYWSGTVFSPNQTFAWFFNMGGGYQNAAEKAQHFYAMAVLDGDVALLSPVPIPAAVWLFGSGLLGLVGMARRKTNV